MSNNDNNLLEWAKKKKDIENKLTPIEIKNKQFTKKLKGYDTHEVDGFINDIYENYKDVFKENLLYKEDNTALREQIKKYKEIEERLNTTLVSSQSYAEELKTKTEKECMEIRAKTSRDGEAIIQKAKERSDEIMQETEKIKEKTLHDLENMKKMYSSEVEKLRAFRDKLVTELKVFFQDKASELQKIITAIKNEDKTEGNP